jgi:hypothetical protein
MLELRLQTGRKGLGLHCMSFSPGPERNREMVEADADLCIALHRSIETSKGTKDCVRQALAAGISVWLVEDERAIPRRTRAYDVRLV